MTGVLFDFTHPDAVQGWRAIDDRVMGGLSRSALRHDVAGHAIFAGQVSLERNGGFASVRSMPGLLGQPGAAAILLEVRGDGRAYKLNVFTEDGFDTVAYQAAFAPAANAWQTVRLPIEAFGATFRGREVPGAPALDPARIRQIGLVFAARLPGPFALDIRSIRCD